MPKVGPITINVKKWAERQLAHQKYFTQEYCIPISFKLSWFDRCFGSLCYPVLCLPCCLFSTSVRVITCSDGGSITYVPDSCMTKYWEIIHESDQEDYAFIENLTSVDDRKHVSDALSGWVKLLSACGSLKRLNRNAIAILRIRIIQITKYMKYIKQFGISWSKLQHIL